MGSSFTEIRKRQLARLGGAKPPTARAAIALAKSQAYQDAADAPATLRAYAADLANYKAWCEKHGFEPMPATLRGWIAGRASARALREGSCADGGASADWLRLRNAKTPARHADRGSLCDISLRAQPCSLSCGVDF